MALRLPGLKQSWFPFAIGGAVIAALARGSSQPASRATANTARSSQDIAAADAQPLPADGEFDIGRRLILDYLRGVGPVAAASSQPAAYTVDVLIATLPDPFDSHLDWIYDAHLDAIRRAFVRAKYLPDRFWIPERRDSVTLSPATKNGPARRIPARDVRPGVMLFRSADPKSTELRLLYLVSELPTTGIYRDAFAAALSERAALARRAGDLSSVALDDRSAIRIVGPTFSGSVPSLERAVASWIAEPGHQRDTFAIISGSATDSAAVERMASTPHVGFHTTIYPDFVADRVFRDSIVGRFGLVKRGPIALLRETGTAYGGSFKDTKNAAVDTTTVVVPFPLNIASLRAEYEKHPEPEPEHPTSLRTPARIPLSLQDSARPKEAPPLRSAVTAATIDASVNEIVGTLLDMHVSAVGIMATDIRDKLFLADLLHHRLPGVRLFTFEANRLYLRPEYSAALRGMVVMSTYPLVVQNQAWTDPQRRPDQLLAFPTDAAEGTYNAALAQLDPSVPLLEYNLPFAHSASDSLAPPVWISVVGGSSLIPVAAVPVLKSGKGAYAPRLLRQTGTALKQASGTDRENVPLGAPMPLVMVLWGALSALIVRILLSARRDLSSVVAVGSDGFKMKTSAPTTEAKEEWFIEDFYQEVERISLDLHRCLYAWLQVVALVALYVPFAATIFRAYSGRGELVFDYVTAGVLLSLGIALAWGLWTLCRSVWVTREIGLRYLRLSLWKKRRGRQLRWAVEVVGRSLVALTGVTFLVLLSIFVVDRMVVWDHSVASYLFLFRSFRTGSGLSPITFIGLAGLGLVAWSEWHRRRIAALREPTPVEQVSAQLRTGEGMPQALDRKEMAIWLGVADRVAEVRARLFLLMPRTGSFFVGATLLVISFWLIPQFGPTFESVAQPTAASWWSRPAPRSFDGLLVGCIVGSLWLTAWTVYRFLAVWEALRRFLTEVANTPLAPTFERLPEPIARMLQPSLFDGDRSDIVEQAVGARLQRLSDISQAAPTTHLQVIGASQLMATPIRKRTAAHEGTIVTEMEPLTIPAPPRTETIEVDSPTTLTETLRGLSVIWERDPSEDGVRPPANAPTASTSNQAEANPSPTQVGDDKLWRRLAEEVVAVRVIEYIASVLRQIRRIAGFLLVSLVTTSLLIASYWFQSEAMVTLVFMVILFGTVGSLVYVSLEMNREDLLSKVIGTDPGKVNWSIGFIVNLTLIGVVPILLAVSSQFPTVRAALFSWVEPILREILHS